MFRGKKCEKSLRLMWHFLLLTYFLPTYNIRPQYLALWASSPPAASI